MKKLFSLFAAVLFAGSMMAAEYTFTSLETPVDAVTDGVTFTFKKNAGSTNPAWNATNNEARLYAKGSLTISSSRKIVKVIYNYVVNKNNKGKIPTIDSVVGVTNIGVWTEETKTWEDTIGDTEITLSTSGDAGNLGFKSITIIFDSFQFPSIIATPNRFELSAEAVESNAVALEYTNFGETFEVQASTDVEWVTNMIFNANNSEFIFDVAANEGDARTATITITATKEEDLKVTTTVKVFQDKYVKPITPITGGEFIKVTSIADVTNDAYLIVHESDSVVFNGSLDTIDVVNNNIKVVIEGDKIFATENTLNAFFYIEMIDGGYSIRAATGNYIGVSSYDNGLKQSDNAYVHNTPTFDEYGNVILSISKESWANDMILCYNDASNQKRFRYYKNGSQKAIQLYKHVEKSISTGIINIYNNNFVKIFKNHNIVIIKGGVKYNILGQRLN